MDSASSVDVESGQVCGAAASVENVDGDVGVAARRWVQAVLYSPPFVVRMRIY